MGYREEADKKFGEIDFSGKDIGIPPMPFDKLAVNSRGELLLVSVFCDQMRVKRKRPVKAVLDTRAA